MKAQKVTELKLGEIPKAQRDKVVTRLLRQDKKLAAPLDVAAFNSSI